MRETTDALASEKLKAQFPLFMFEEFDSSFPNAPWIIGLKSDYPEELFRRIAAAMISIQLGLRSIDNVYKNYVMDLSYPSDTRLDKEVMHQIRADAAVFGDALIKITFRDERKVGRMLFEWTLMRFGWTSRHILSCANRGSIFEVVAISRMALEQIAWAWAIDRSRNPEVIVGTSATRAIGVISKRLNNVGRFYGWMSEYAHWDSKAHIRAMIRTQEGNIGMQFASSLYKAQSYVVLLGLLIIAVRALRLRRPKLLKLMNAPADLQRYYAIEKNCRRSIRRIVQADPDRTIAQLAGFFGVTKASRLSEATG